MLSEVITRARRRLLWNALAFHFAIAVTVALAVLSLLLLLGTDILDWRWLIFVPAAPLATGIFVALRRLPRPYPTAQLLDRRLKLADSLSTALFFAGPHQAHRCDDGTRQAQQADATRIAASVDIREAFPIRFPRASYLAVLPAIVAAGLFDIRYRSDARLDLRPPLTAIVQQLLEDVTSELAKLEDQLQQLLTPDRQKDEEAEKQKPDAGDEEASASNPPDTSAAKTAGSGSAARQQTEVADNKLAEEPQAAQQEQQFSEDSQAGSEPNSSSTRDRDGRQQQKKSAAGDPQSGSSNSESSVLNKLKDSMANLLSMMKPNPGSSGKQQTGKSRDGNSQDSRKQSDQASDSANAEPGADSPRSGDAKSLAPGQSSNPGADKQAGTGAGNEEGIKEIIRAEQLEAMGKLDAIFGKRAQNIAGEFTAEATQGPQQLKTAYQQRTATHTDVHAKAERDEVPVAFQDYVERYFELVNNAAAPVKGSPRAVSASTRRPRTAR